MPHPDEAVVTGAFSFMGRHVAKHLVDQGVRVRTLTKHADREVPIVVEGAAGTLEVFRPVRAAPVHGRGGHSLDWCLLRRN